MGSEWFDGKSGGSKSEVDVAKLINAPIVKALVRVIEAGALVSIGTTRDRGAMSVTVTHDGNYKRDYFREVDELVMWLTAAYEAVTSSDDGASPAGRSSRRR